MNVSVETNGPGCVLTFGMRSDHLLFLGLLRLQTYFQCKLPFRLSMNAICRIFDRRRPPDFPQGEAYRQLAATAA